MAKIMLFIDGTWLYANNVKLSESYHDASYKVDFGKLPEVLAQKVAERLGSAEVDVVRTYLFGSYAANYDPKDENRVAQRKDFFEMLKEEYHYEVETFPINFMGRRVRKADRDPADPFEPKEKCVDIALATNMLYLAAIPYAYDIAIAVMGDRDFMPMLQSVRRLGKRVAIASIKNSCAPEFADPSDQARIKDFDIIWLEDLLEKLELKYERHQLYCESPTHKGDRMVWTMFHPRKHQKFYCDKCREDFLKQKEISQIGLVSSQPDKLPPDNGAPTETIKKCVRGKVKKLVQDKQYGFIGSEDGKDYYFHLTDVGTGQTFTDFQEGVQVDFEVRKEPGGGKAGAATDVRRSAEQVQ